MLEALPLQWQRSMRCAAQLLPTLWELWGWQASLLLLVLAPKPLLKRPRGELRLWVRQQQERPSLGSLPLGLLPQESSPQGSLPQVASLLARRPPWGAQPERLRSQEPPSAGRSSLWLLGLLSLRASPKSSRSQKSQAESPRQGSPRSALLLPALVVVRSFRSSPRG